MELKSAAFLLGSELTSPAFFRVEPTSPAFLLA